MFKVCKVLYYVKDNTSNNKKKILSLIKNNEKITNTQFFPQNITNVSDHKVVDFINFLPIGTVICRELNKENINKVMFCYPMLSMHVSLPINSGEMVWVYENNAYNMLSEDVRLSNLSLDVQYYWISKKIGSMLTEDLNYSNIQNDSFVGDSPNKIFSSNFSQENIVEQSLSKAQNKASNESMLYPTHKITDAYKTSFKNTAELDSVKSLIAADLKDNNFFPKIVPRYYSKPYELTLQGRNNTLINLTKSNNTVEDNFKKNSGLIDIVSGRHSLYNYSEINEEDIITLKKKVLNPDKSDDSLYSEKVIDKSSPITFIKNKDYEEEYPYEILKDDFTYLGEHIFSDIEVKKETLLDYENDSSRLLVAEFYEDIDDGFHYNTLFKNSMFTIDKSKNNNDKLKTISEVKNKNNENLLKDEKIITNQNFSSYLHTDIINFANAADDPLDEEFFYDDALDKNLPLIFIKSNNIRIVSRNKKENINDKLEPGSISIIKESEDFKKYSQISIEKDGKIKIDGNKIYLGNVLKEYISQDIIQENIDLKSEDFEDYISNIESQYESLKHEDLAHMHGNGEGLLIGYDSKFSEPLVLGNTLSSFLKEILTINIQIIELLSNSLDEVKNNFENINKNNENIINYIDRTLSSHTHPTAAPGSPSPPTLPIDSATINFSLAKSKTTATNDASTKNRSEKSQRLDEIKNNLHLMLSRFAKST